MYFLRIFAYFSLHSTPRYPIIGRVCFSLTFNRTKLVHLISKSTNLHAFNATLTCQLLLK